MPRYRLVAHGDEFRLEQEVGIGGGEVQPVDRQHVHVRPKQANVRGDVDLFVGDGKCVGVDRRGGRTPRQCPRGVPPGDLNAVEVRDEPVVVHHAQRQRSRSRQLLGAQELDTRPKRGVDPLHLPAHIGYDDVLEGLLIVAEADARDRVSDHPERYGHARIPRALGRVVIRMEVRFRVAIGRSGTPDQSPAADGPAEQTQIEADVRTARACLVNGGGDRVRPGVEVRDGYRSRTVFVTVPISKLKIRILPGEREIVSRHLHTVDVDHPAVIAEHLNPHVDHIVAERELAAEIRRVATAAGGLADVRLNTPHADSTIAQDCRTRARLKSRSGRRERWTVIPDRLHPRSVEIGIQHCRIGRIQGMHVVPGGSEFDGVFLGSGLTATGYVHPVAAPLAAHDNTRERTVADVHRVDLGLAVAPAHEVHHLAGVVDHHRPAGTFDGPVDRRAPVVVGGVVGPVEHFAGSDGTGQLPPRRVDAVDTARTVVDQNGPVRGGHRSDRSVLDLDEFCITDADFRNNDACGPEDHRVGPGRVVELDGGPALFPFGLTRGKQAGVAGGRNEI